MFLCPAFARIREVFQGKDSSSAPSIDFLEHPQGQKGPLLVASSTVLETIIAPFGTGREDDLFYRSFVIICGGLHFNKVSEHHRRILKADTVQSKYTCSKATQTINLNLNF